MDFIFKKEWLDTIKKYAPLSEEIGKLHPEILNLIYEQQWFNLYVPKIYGGQEKSLPEILRIEENLAKADGSLAWTVTLCSGAAWFSSFLDSNLAHEIFANKQTCFAGSGAVTGTAVKTTNGYLINGLWKYASGALHGTIFTANCLIKNNDGTAVFDENGEELVLSFILKKEEVNILPGWSYFGLIATGSHAFEAINIEVPANRVFKINGPLTVNIKSLNYPFLQMAETTLVVNYSGMTLHFLELIDDYFYNRSGIKRYTAEQIIFFENELKKLKTIFYEARNTFFNSFDISWQDFIENKECNPNLLKKVSLHSRQLAHTARKVIDTLYPYCGLEAAKKESELNRVWRDFHTATQHSLLTFEF